MRLPVLILCCALSSVAAQAGETVWQEVAPGVQLRLVSTGEIKADGTTMVGIEIDMPSTTKTYWRVPGDTGLPTELDLSGSSGVAGHQILWPYPTRHQTADYLDYAYFGPTLLPVQLAVSANAPQLELDAVLGICSEICVPAQAHFSLPLVDEAPDRPNGLRIRQSMAEWPMPWSGDPSVVGVVQVDAAAGMLAVEVSPQMDWQSLIAATATGEPLFGTPQKSGEQNLVLIPILGVEPLAEVVGQEIELNFMTQEGAFQVGRVAKAKGAN